MKVTTTEGNHIDFEFDSVTLLEGKKAAVLSHGYEIGGYVIITEIGRIQLDESSTKAVRGSLCN